MSAIAVTMENQASSSSAETEILTLQAQEFLRALDRRFEGRRVSQLHQRAERQRQFDAGVLPQFPAETRACNWESVNVSGRGSSVSAQKPSRKPISLSFSVKLALS